MGITTATRELVEDIVIGGCVLGGGGGGAIADGRRLATEALRIGTVRIATVDDLDQDAKVVTASAVGSPSTVSPRGIGIGTYVDSIKRFISYYEGAPVGGVISCENGGLASVNGWVQAAAAGIVVVDAPANGRAHPTGLMGSMSLEELGDYESHQVVIAEGPEGNRAEAYLRGDLLSVTDSVRALAAIVPGLAANIRNPVSVDYLRKNAAVGALAQATRVGRAMNRAGHKGTDRIGAAAEVLGGRMLFSGIVQQSEVWVKGGYDYGRLTISGHDGFIWHVPFWNEYLGAETQGVYASTFPDLTMTFDLVSGDPLPSSSVSEGDAVAVLVVPHSQLILGSGCRPDKVSAVVQETLGRIDLLAAGKDW